MKILALGALWVPYIRDNWFDALKTVFQEQVVCINAAPLLINKEKYTNQPESFHSAYIYNLIRREKFDYLFFYHDWIFADYTDEFFEKVRAAGVKTITFHPDDEPDTWYLRNIKYDHHYDIVASHSSRGVRNRKQQGWSERALYLPWGYNPRTCYRLDQSHKQYDLVFFGKHKVNEVDERAHLEDGLQRENVLVHLAQLSEEQGWSFKVFGYGWEKHPVLKNYAGGLPSQDEMVQILNQSKIVFNPAWSSDGTDAVQTKLRHFEVPGCGAFQITNNNQELAELFQVDREIVFYDSDAQLFEKLKYYLEHDIEREAIADAGYKRCLAQHTLDLRAQELFEHVSKIYPPAEEEANGTLHRVKQIPIDTLASLKKFYEQLCNDDALLGDGEWVHFHAGTFDSVTCNYDVLQSYLSLFPNNVLSVSSFVQFKGDREYNPLQPKLVETNSCLLTTDIDTSVFGFSLLNVGSSDKELFLGVEHEKTIEVLVNYIVPKNAVKQLLKSFVSQDFDAVRNMDVIPTGCVVSEINVSLPPNTELAWPNIDSFEYVKRLKALLPIFIVEQKSVVVYGVSGMGKTTLELFESFASLNCIGLIDRSLNAKFFNELPVIQADDLNRVKPDILILTAGASGPSIYESIKHLEGSICILPLYDLDHPVWRTLGL
jgi:hypothetical protein